MGVLLAVDLGLKTGVALFGRDGRLISYRSQNYGSAARLRRGVPGVLNGEPDLAWLVLEGGGPLARIWETEAERREIGVRRIAAEDWRRCLLYPREQRHQPKRTAQALARRVITWSDAPRPTSLRHDAAEAILIGLWGVLDLGWLDRVPDDVRR